MNQKPTWNRFISGVHLFRQIAATIAVFAGAEAPLEGVNWEGANVSETLIDGDAVAELEANESAISNAFSMTRRGCKAALLYGGFSKGFVVRVDGKDGARYEDIREETPLFSPNGEAVAYCARKDGKWRWVINGVEGPAFEMLTPTSFAFSADGKRHAYVARAGFQRNVLVVDGKLEAGGERGKPIPFDSAPTFSPDGSRLAYVELMAREGVLRVNLDGEPGPWTEGIGARLSEGFGAFPNGSGGYSRPRVRPTVSALEFSDDSKRFAYTEIVGNRGRMVIDGVPTPLYENVGIDFVFAPDGSDYAFMIADSEGRHTIVRSGGEALPVDIIIDYTLTFSADGRRLGFAGTRDGWDAVWVNGKAAAVDIPARDYYGPLYFSPDSKRIAFVVKGEESSEWHWVVDGKAEAGAENVITDFSFSADSSHYCYPIILGSGKGVGIVVDGKLRATHALVHGAAFQSDGSLEYIASDGRGRLSLFRVTGF